MIDIPEGTRIIIVEGIAGAGKTTLMKQLAERYVDRNIYIFWEQELLLSWKHIHVPHISSLRLDFFNHFLDHVERKIREEEDTIFIFERFHLSIKILEWEFEREHEARYNRVLSRLKALPVFILITSLERSLIKRRVTHDERSEQWHDFVSEKLVLRNFNNLESLSIDQQNQFFKLAREQGIPYASIAVRQHP